MSTTVDTAPSSPKRGEARTRAILQATLELIAEVGFDRMTMDNVATRAKASKATIYRRWPDKTALTLEALGRRSGVVHSIPDTGTLRGDLELYVRAAAAAASGSDGSLAIGLLAVASRDRQLAAMLGKQFHDNQVPTITELVDRARKRQEVGPDADATTIAEVLPGTLIMHIIVLGLPADEEFIRRVVDDVVLPLLTARNQAPQPEPQQGSSTF
jgi:AcrR family transcriptional regulator